MLSCGYTPCVLAYERQGQQEKIMEPESVEVEVWVIVDESGDTAIGTDSDAAIEAYEDSIGGNLPRRLMKVLLTVPVPKPIIVRGKVMVPPEQESAIAVA
jgi:hypothetical protein